MRRSRAGLAKGGGGGGGSGSPSRLSCAPDDRSPDCSCSWRKRMMEKARRLLSVMAAQADAAQALTAGVASKHTHTHTRWRHI